MKKYALITALAILLAACGGGRGNGNAGAGGTANDEPGGGMAMNAFTAFVASLIGTSSDSAEPQEIDSVPVSTADTSEPAPVM